MVTLEQIKSRPNLLSDWERLAIFLGLGYGDTTPITIDQLLESNGLESTLRIVQNFEPNGRGLARHFAVDCAAQVKHLLSDVTALPQLEGYHISNALEVARKFARGEASVDDLYYSGQYAQRAAKWLTGEDPPEAAYAAWAAFYTTVHALPPVTNSFELVCAANNAARAVSSTPGQVLKIQKAQFELLKIYFRESKRPDNSEKLLADLIEKHKGAS